MNICKLFILSKWLLRRLSTFLSPKLTCYKMLPSQKAVLPCVDDFMLSVLLL